MATVLPDGRPHLVAMWYAVVDGEIWFETKAKSQKAVNLRRDPTITVMIEDGQTYDTLRGVSIDGRAEIIDDPETNLRVGISVWERYTGPYTDEMRPFVDQMMNNRICGARRAGPDAQLGSPQARHARDAGGWQHRGSISDAAGTPQAAGLAAAAEDLQIRGQGARRGSIAGPAARSAASGASVRASASRCRRCCSSTGAASRARCSSRRCCTCSTAPT